MERFLSHFYASYCMSALAVLFALTGFALSMIRKNEQLSVFSFYCLFYPIDISLGYINDFFIGKPYYNATSNIAMVGDTIFTLFEFFVFSFYIRKETISADKKKKIGYLMYLYTFSSLMILVSLVYSGGFKSHIKYLFVHQAFFLLAIAALYYIDSIQNLRTTSSFKQPSFLIITGLTFCLLGSLPLSFFVDYLFDYNALLYNQLFSIVYVLYCIMFLTIIKAFLYKPVPSE